MYWKAYRSVKEADVVLFASGFDLNDLRRPIRVFPEFGEYQFVGRIAYQSEPVVGVLIDVVGYVRRVLIAVDAELQFFNFVIKSSLEFFHVIRLFPFGYNKVVGEVIEVVNHFFQFFVLFCQSLVSNGRQIHIFEDKDFVLIRGFDGEVVEHLLFETQLKII